MIVNVLGEQVNVCVGGCLHKPVVVAMYGLPWCVIVPVADIHLNVHNEKLPCSVHAGACVCGFKGVVTTSKR